MGKDTFANATKYNNYLFQDERSNVFVYARTQIYRYTSKHSLFGCYSHCNRYLRLIMLSYLKNLKLIWGGEKFTFGCNRYFHVVGSKTRVMDSYHSLYSLMKGDIACENPNVLSIICDSKVFNAISP